MGTYPNPPAVFSDDFCSAITSLRPALPVKQGDHSGLMDPNPATQNSVQGCQIRRTDNMRVEHICISVDPGVLAHRLSVFL